MKSVFEKARPTTKWCDVTTTLADFAIITYSVKPSALAAHLAPGFEPEVFTLADGSQCAFISAVPFRDLDFRFGCAEWAKFAFGQTNYRAYVLYKGQRCVWFFGTSLDTIFVNIPRHLWQLPWHAAKMAFNTQWTNGECIEYRLKTEAAWAPAMLHMAGTSERMGALDGFSSIEETAEVLTHPLAGYFRRRDGKPGTYSVWHDRLELKRAVVKDARFELFEQLGLIERASQPHSALVQEHTEFVIVLPPQVLAEQ